MDQEAKENNDIANTIAALPSKEVNTSPGLTMLEKILNEKLVELVKLTLISKEMRASSCDLAPLNYFAEEYANTQEK